MRNETYEKIILDKIRDINFAVYEYYEEDTGIVRYIGIVNNGTLSKRHSNHMGEEWYKSANYKLRYLLCGNQSETESIEAHLINSYPEGQLFNKSKVGWGRNKYLPNEYEFTEIDVTKEDVLICMENFVNYAKCDNATYKRVSNWIQLLREVSK